MCQVCPKGREMVVIAEMRSLKTFSVRKIQTIRNCLLLAMEKEIKTLFIRIEPKYKYMN